MPATTQPTPGFLRHAASSSSGAPPSSGGHLVTSDDRDFILLRSELRAQAAGGLARVTLSQRFENPYDEPLQVSYTLPLPSDGAISGFAFVVDGKRTVGEVSRRERARERFRDAILEGRSAALLDQERSSVFSQEIGNVPPHGELVVEVSIDQPLRWLAEGQWEWRFPTVVGPRYMGADGRVADAGALTVPVDEAAATAGPRATLSLRIDDATDGGAPESPSHRLRVSGDDAGVEVAFDPDGDGDAGVALDRDVVVRWQAARSDVAAEVRAHRPASGHARAGEAFGLLSVTPPSDLAGFGSPLPRELVFLIDTSGSMHGEPLAQAARIATAMIDTLGDGDRLELIEFSDRPRPWRRRPVAATAANRRDACDWVRSLQSRGATEMRDGIVHALRPLSDESQRQVVLITDGWIGFETEIVREIHDRLPAASRLHAIGVGHAPNRSLTEPAARAGRGCEAIVAPGEDAERVAHRMVQHTAAPLLVNFDLGGSALRGHAPAALPDLFAGCPARVPLRLDPAGGELVLRAQGANGEWTRSITVPAVETGGGNPAIACRYAREAVEDLELRRASGAGSDDLDARIEALGLEFQIATRLTSWVAVSDEATVDPQAPTRKRKLAQALPAGTSIERLGLRSPQPLLGSVPLAEAMSGFVDLPFDEELESAAVSHQRAARLLQMSRPPKFARREPVEMPAIAGGPGDDDDSILESVGLPRLVARLIRQDDSELVFEIEIDRALDWRPKRAHLRLDGGGHVTARIDRRRSTRKGETKPGQVVRLTLKLDRPLPAEVVSMIIEQGRHHPLVLGVA